MDADPTAPWGLVVQVGLFMSLGQFALLYTALAGGMPPGLASLVLQAQVALSLLVDGSAEVAHALTHLSWAAVASTAYTAVLASLVGYGIWNSLLGRHRTSAVVPFTLLVPPVGMTAAWLVLGEVPNVAEAGGGAVLLVGVAIAALSGRGGPAVETSPLPGAARARESVGLGEE